ncbi:MAG: TerB family tellurite resistance protein [Myxococcales bacterium]|jgi:uncharacterized membrane protein YebE (DUF533 family)|nr:TerB family tellurite resistance protein [Myxococcales bacterium]
MKRLTLGMDACVETLALLIAIAWADGKLEDREKEGVKSAASVLNLTKEMRDRLDGLLEKPMPIDQLLVESLSSKERAFAYVAAAWMTGVDDDVDPKEVAMLDEAAGLFGFDDATKRELTQIARDLEPLRKKGSEADWASELIALFKAIPPRVERVSGDVEVVFG